MDKRKVAVETKHHLIVIVRLSAASAKVRSILIWLEVFYRLLDFHFFIHNFKSLRNRFCRVVHVLMHDLRWRTILWQSLGNHSRLKILFRTGIHSDMRKKTSLICVLPGYDRPWLITFSFVPASIYPHIFRLGHMFQLELALKFTNALLSNKFLLKLIVSLLSLFNCQSPTPIVLVAHLGSVDREERRI